jgi:hypothetical protein
MFCSNCGAQFSGKFCSSCGSPSAQGNPASSTPDPVVFIQTRSVSPTYPNAQTSGLAIAALVVSFFIPFLGIILGFVARSDISNSKGSKTGENLANLGIILGFIFTFLQVALFVFYFALWFG